MLRRSSGSIPFLAGIGLLASLGRADAAILADVTRALGESRPGEPVYIEPWFEYGLYDPESGLVIDTRLHVPNPAGDSVFDFTGAALAAIAGSLTDREPADRHSFTLGLGRTMRSGFSLTDAGLFPGLGGDLLGRASVEGVRITLTDVCFQPFGIEGCPTVPAGDSGYYGEVRFQVFGTLVGEVPEPGSLMLLGTGLLLLVGATRSTWVLLKN